MIVGAVNSAVTGNQQTASHTVQIVHPTNLGTTEEPTTVYSAIFLPLIQSMTGDSNVGRSSFRRPVRVPTLDERVVGWVCGVVPSTTAPHPWVVQLQQFCER